MKHLPLVIPCVVLLLIIAYMVSKEKSPPAPIDHRDTSTVAGPHPKRLINPYGGQP